MTKEDKYFMQRAIEIARIGMESNDGGPFGAVVVKDGKIIAEGNNKVSSTNDPTAHAEVVAIRNACAALGFFQLDGCTIYTSCEPCPMCLGAIYWARPDNIFYACSREDAARVGFDDDFIYKEISLSIPDRTLNMHQLMNKEANEVFKLWEAKEDKTVY
jgi:guanine deaminase